MTNEIHYFEPKRWDRQNTVRDLTREILCWSETAKAPSSKLITEEEGDVTCELCLDLIKKQYEFIELRISFQLANIKQLIAHTIDSTGNRRGRPLIQALERYVEELEALRKWYGFDQEEGNDVAD